MALPALSNLQSLMGQPPPEALDVQQALAQAAFKQQIAQALLGQSLQQEPATIHTGGANPFARDVPNIGVLGNIAEAFIGNKALGQSQDAQNAIANFAMQRKMDDLRQAFTGTMGVESNAPQGGMEGPPTAPATEQVPPSLPMVAQRLQLSADPSNQARGAAIMDKLIEAGVKQMPTAADVVKYSQYNVPGSFSTTAGDYGIPKVNMSTAVSKVTPLKTESGDIGTISSEPGAQVKPAGAIPTTPSTITPASESPTGGPIATAPGTGRKTELTGPEQQATVDVAKREFAAASEAKDNILGFVEATPTYMTMAKLAKSAYEQGTMGAGAPFLNELKKWGVRLGIVDDKMNQITDLETFLKFAVPAATTRLRENVGARPSTIEYKSFLEALGATGVADPRTVLNVVQDRLVNGMNMAEVYKNRLIPTLTELTGWKGVQKALTSLNFDPETDVIAPLGKALGTGTPIPMRLEQNKATGLWSNSNIANPAYALPAVAPTPGPVAPSAVDWIRDKSGKLIKNPNAGP